LLRPEAKQLLVTKGKLPMRILEVVHDFLISCKAGSEYHTYYLAKELSKNHVVKLFFTMPEDGSQKKLVEGYYDGINYRALKKNYSSFYQYPYRERDKMVDTVFTTLIEDFKPDLIHFQHLINLSINLPSIAKRKGIPTFFTLHDYWLLCPKIIFLTSNQQACNGNVPGNCIRCMSREHKKSPAGTAAACARKAAAYVSLVLWRAYWVKKIFHDIDMFIAPSRFLLEKYVQYGLSREKIVLVRHGLDANIFRGIKRSPSSTIRFGFVGTISEHKGIYVLIDAFNKVSGKAELKIYGRVPEQMLPELNKRIENRCIHIMGELSEKDKSEAFSELDVLIVPSLCYENCPLTINEAFLAKIPVITADLGGMVELIENGRNGFTFPAGNSKKLAEKINLFIKNPDLVGQLACHIPVVKDIRTNAAEILSIYKNLPTCPRRVETAEPNAIAP
jgi:glycosyltransferase involved in cell wall biosynthesis